MIGWCDNCGRRRRLHRWQRSYFVCGPCAEQLARGRAMVERLFNRRRAA